MDFRLVSFKLCPFVQRSVITLLEKGVEFNIEYIDLQNKPDWFLKLSPLGKVPLLQTQGTTLFESAVINEYIDETAGERIMPQDPLERARQRMWIEFGSSLIVDIWRAQSTDNQDTYDSALKSIQEKCHRLEGILTGPLFLGEKFSLVDAAIAPALQRISWVSELEPKLDVFEKNNKCQNWLQSLESRDSVRKSLVPEIKELFFTWVKDIGGVLARV